MQMGQDFETVFRPDSRFLDVIFGDDTMFKVEASSETGNHVRESRTWRFEHNGFAYRVQLQVTPKERPSFH